MRLTFTILFSYAAWAGFGQAGIPLSATIEADRFAVDYDVRFNLRFDRSVGFRDYKARLLQQGAQSAFLMYPKGVGISEEGPEMEISFGPDTLFRVWKDFSSSVCLFGDVMVSGGETRYADTLHPMSWRLVDERRRIGSWECLRADAAFKGRRYTAWYAPDIPVPNGPWKLGGLPGLVIEAYDSDRNLMFTAVEVHADTLPSAMAAMPAGTGRDYEAYRNYWRKVRDRFNGTLASAGDPSCVSCLSKTEVRFHVWERILER